MQPPRAGSRHADLPEQSEGLLARVPFPVLRVALLVRDLAVDRHDPDLVGLRGIDDPERFVWAMLPHAARTFSSCITLLPGRAARISAVAYLYCRMLDTYEDLLTDPAARDAALERFPLRLLADPAAAQALPEAPRIAHAHVVDERDAAHLLLVERCCLVDRVFARFAAEERRLIYDLVASMAAGMRWSSSVFARQGGVLENEHQLTRYCREVIGHPVVFSLRLLRLLRRRSTELPEPARQDAMVVSEMIQLANVTRDIEKDLLRGVAYHPLLREDLGRDVFAQRDAALTERVRRVREQLLTMALERAPAYRELLASLGSRRLSLARASAVLMLLFTDGYYRGCGRRVGWPGWGARRSGVGLLIGALPALFSERRAETAVDRIVRAFAAAAREARARGVPLAFDTVGSAAIPAAAPETAPSRLASPAR
ncbi:MAG: squalene/phytoene synthase family protein [Acidobacteriota bacterium]|nr:MAG: squalene/phytoene synthase family protein [Acidobacteriota bacterium]